MLTRKSARNANLVHCNFPTRPSQLSQGSPIDLSRFLTLHSRLRPRRRQQPHTPHHKILKRLVTRLSLLTHVFRKARDLRRRCRSLGREWADMRNGRLVVFTCTALDGVGFGSPLLRSRCGESWNGGR